MILIDSERLELGALSDEKHKLHEFAKVYDSTLSFLKKRFKNGVIHFWRPDRPLKTKGADSKMNEIPNMTVPTEIMSIPLSATTALAEINTGKHTWTCSMGAARPLPHGLWEPGGKKRIHIKESYSVDINKEPDLAFFLYKICPMVQKGLIRIKDPIALDEERGKAEYELVQRKTAVWTMLQDENKLRTMARAYGMNDVDKKLPNTIRIDLEGLLERNDKLKRSNPAIKGTQEFIEEMKVTDNLLLRAFTQRCLDERRLSWKPDGRYRIGEKIVCHVPQPEINRRMDYLCNWLMAGDNKDKLEEYIRDLISIDYLDSVTDRKEVDWLARIAGINPQFKKMEELATDVKNAFCPVV
jgi:hypothetical protein